MQEYEVKVACYFAGAEHAPGERVWLFQGQATYLVAGGFLGEVPSAPTPALADEKKGTKA